MYVRLLGTAAGGGFPQWNCNCDNCRSVRTAGRHGAQTRTQSCVALSGDGRRWLLLNASPDIGRQIETFAPLLPPSDTRRGTGISGVLITNADLDHTLGLLLLREGRALTVHATPAVRTTLTRGLRLHEVLSCYGGVEWREPPYRLAPLSYTDGTPSGLLYQAFLLPGKPPRYLTDDDAEGDDVSIPSEGQCVGYRFVDAATGGRLVFMPDLAEFSAEAQAQLLDCDALLLDGTFWSEHEMQSAGVGDTPAARMGHLPVGGPEGSLARIAALDIRYKIYVHINNTNPILLPDTPERMQVEAAGCVVGYDGMELML
jgi:pyrroloquinoline quinone biosynthesis protein B